MERTEQQIDKEVTVRVEYAREPFDWLAQQAEVRELPLASDTPEGIEVTGAEESWRIHSQ